MAYIFILSIVTPLALLLLLGLLSRVVFIKKLLPYGPSISAGILTSLIFFKFLPHSLETASPTVFSKVFLVSIIIMIFIESYIIPYLPFSKLFPANSESNSSCNHEHNFHHHISHSGSFSAIGCLLCCTFFDGVRFGSSLFIDSKASLFLSAGLLAHLIPEGLSVLFIAKTARYSNKASFLLKIFLCLALGFGIALNGVFHFEEIEHWILIFSTASLFYVVFVHLAPFVLKRENHKLFFFTLIISSLLISFSDFH